MANPKDVLVTTTSSLEGLKIKRYLKPVSSHIVTGTNLFSDFFASLTDVFGGRSATYQKQLTSVYSEAIEKIQNAAYEIGANCIVGLRIDMDEISGKGKSMFMLTAVGTAVVLETDVTDKGTVNENEKLKNVPVERIEILRRKKEVIEEANSNILVLNNDNWDFLTANQVDEVFPFVLNEFSDALPDEHVYPETFDQFYKPFIGYVDALTQQKKLHLLYNAIGKLEDERLTLKLSEILEELNLFDFNRTMELLRNNNFKVQKLGVRIATYDKPFYNKQDVDDLKMMRDYIQTSFVERGQRTTKKQILSSKQKEAWTCECGKTNDLDTYCSKCDQDIFGFKQNEITAKFAASYLEEKIDLVNEYIE